MKAKLVYTLIVCAALAVTLAMLSHDWGIAVSPLTKMFILFFGLILGFQAMPALLHCSSLLKNMVKPGLEEKTNSR
jgi:hypothetical protein